MNLLWCLDKHRCMTALWVEQCPQDKTHTVEAKTMQVQEDLQVDTKDSSVYLASFCRQFNEAQLAPVCGVSLKRKI